MSSIRRATILKLAAMAHEMNLDVMSGPLVRQENGRWTIGQDDLISWLEEHSGEDLVFVMGAMTAEQRLETRTCRTCGRDYTGIDCPYCRANRIRLRGHA